MSLAIRAVTAADVAEWLRMRRVLLPDDPGHDAEARDYFARSRRECVTLVAERRGGGLAGFVEVGSRGFAEGCDSQPVAYIEGWYVEPDLRRRGVADWARAAGFRELGSDAEVANEASQAAHRAVGFAEVVRIVCFRRALTEPA
ncbi:MAG TPA: GNAT family N-acetyltransferase [Gemmataceae bacterium]|nr:GNAT family N-acetyltransferase [Gemmataceae bacterium]